MPKRLRGTSTCARADKSNKGIARKSGDIDLFRPKGAVTDEHDQAVAMDQPPVGKQEHPDYWWLAHE